MKLKSSLLEIVKDRTGYPVEMLDLNASLEADLGIDSIKRVEIISAFRRSELATLLALPADFVERLTSARSLQAILDCVADITPASEPAKSAAALVTAKKEDAVSDRKPMTTNAELQDQLVKIVAERTGYPSEMLDLDANLEADLGIDSIKRVEIIAAFRRGVLTGLTELPTDLMEQLTAAKTIRAIVERITTAAQSIPGAVVGSAVLSTDEGIGTTEAAAIFKQKMDSSSLLAMLVQVVADRTGYPAEMLDPNAKLEADLGIDSIKRVEIISAFRRIALPEMKEPPVGFIERLTAAKSMRELVECICAADSADITTVCDQTNAASVSSTTAASSNTTAINLDRLASSVMASDDSCPRSAMTAVEKPFPQELLELAHGAIVICEDDSGLAQALEAQLSSSGRDCIRLNHRQSASRGEIHRAIDETRRKHGRIAAIVHLTALSRAPEFPGISTTQWKQFENSELKGLLYLLQAVGPELSQDHGKRVHVLALTIGGGDFNVNPRQLESAHPWRGGIAGLLKVAAKEYPDHLFRTIDFDVLPDAATVLHELVVIGPEEIGYRGSRRLALQAKLSAESIGGTTKIPLNSQSVVLVTAGGQGITSQIVQEMAAHTKATFILLGRSPVPATIESEATAAFLADNELRAALISQSKASGKTPAIPEIERHLARIKSDRAIRYTLSEMVSAGVKTEYICCDVRNRESLASVVAHVQKRYGMIDAIVHGAGVLRDQLIGEKTDEAFDLVISTKVDSLLNLLELVPPDQLKLVVLFASVSGVFGNTGQCDYAAANEILNRCARRLQTSSSAKIVALNWGPWADVGMVTPEIAKKMLAHGVSLITPNSGRLAAWREIVANRGDGVRSILGRGPWIESPMHSVRKLSPQIHVPIMPPLLNSKQVERHQDGRVSARLQLIPSQQKLLSDHCIDGRSVLPLAVALELMAEAATVADGLSYPIIMDDVRMLSGIVVEHAGREIVVQTEEKTRCEEFDSYRVHITPPDANRRLYQAIVRFPRKRLDPALLSDLSRIDRPSDFSAADAYERSLFHGPTFQVIEEITRSDESGIDALVRPSDPRACIGPNAGTWIVDPLVLDAGPQLGMVWSQEFRDVVMLPTRIARFSAYAPLGNAPVEMYLRIQDGSEANAYRADLWVACDGVLIWHIQGLEGVGSPQLNRITAGRSG
ncbi:MAG TPA: SDR family NAD(P)-dependent oxidoreductase, partial [Pirellulales bacterium]